MQFTRILALFLVMGTARAQSLLHDFPAPFTDAAWGHAVACPGDVNLDGFGDVLVSTYFGGPSNSGGTVWLYSGRDGQLLLNWTGGSTGPHGIGWDVAPAGDLNLDGRPDVLVGGSGNAVVFSGAGGGTLLTLTGPPDVWTFGRSVASLGDVDLDGRPDYLVGASNDTHPFIESGAGYVHSGASGALLYAVDGQGTRDALGYCVSSAGDVNGDGRSDLALGAPRYNATPPGPGYVLIVSGADGSMIRRVDGTSAGDQFGVTLDLVGDVNADGIPDLIVGALNASAGGLATGSAALISGADGSRLRTWYGQTDGGHFGISVAGAGDVDRDGRPDVLIGASGENPHGTWSGRSYVYSSRDGGRLLTFEGDSAQDRLGYSCASGLIDADGFPDLVVGAVNDAPGGRVRVWSPCPLPARTYCSTAPNSQTFGALIGSTGSTSIAQNNLTLTVTDAIANGSGLFYCGSGSVQAPFGDGWRCVGGSTSRLGPVQVANGLGAATRTIDINVAPFAAGPLHVLPGSLRYFQYWYRNPAGPGGTGFNLSDGLAVTFCP